MDPNKPDSTYRSWLVRSRSTRNPAHASLLPSCVTGDSRSTRQTASGARKDQGAWSEPLVKVSVLGPRLHRAAANQALALGAWTIRTFRTPRRCVNGSIAPTPRHFLSPTHDYVYSTLLYSTLFHSVLFCSVLLPSPLPFYRYYRYQSR